MENNYHMAYPAPDEHGAHLRQGSPHHHYHGYRQAMPSVIDPALQNQRSSFGSTSAARIAASPPPRHMRAGSMRSVQSSPRMLHSSPRLQRTGTPTSTVGRAAYSMSPPPLFESASRSAHRTVDHHMVDSPAPPPRDITDSNINEIYVKFILYANPGVPQNVDTTELRRVFRAPPRSDGKSFSIYTLWQLIKKLDNKELKTWSQLAIELGVEPPSSERGQSAQKIQQYAVRLKRWMRAMHIDAFFEYCLGKSHRYYTELPTIAGNASEEGRDGVPLEEDLALRALMPEWRPKRGRRKNEDKESETSMEQPAAKHPRLDPHHSAVEYDGLGMHSVIFPASAAPWSAYPDDMNHDTWVMAPGMPHSHEASTSAHPSLLQGRAGYDFTRWRRDVSPAVYPHSAVTLGHRQPEHVITEPQSAITPSISRKSGSRRRHGPAVSSAWPSKGGAGNGKQRGRPPSSRPAPDEAQAETHSYAAPHPSLSSSGKFITSHRVTTPGSQREDQAILRRSASQTPLHQPQATSSQPRPNKLQLQVPERYGGPIRLATPPRLLVNGNGRLRRNSVDYFRHAEGEDDDDASAVEEESKPPEAVESQQQHDPYQRHHHDDFTIEDVARAFATRLLGIQIIGRPDGLTVEEANTLASKAALSICGDKAALRSSPQLSHVAAMKCAITLGVEKAMGMLSSSIGGGNANLAVDSHLSVRAVFQNPDGSIGRSRKPETTATATTSTNGSNKNSSSSNSAGKGSYNYNISIDTTTTTTTTTSDTTGASFSTNTQLRDLLVALPAHHPASTTNNDESSFLQLREQVKSLVEVPASAVEPITALNGVAGGESGAVGMDAGLGKDKAGGRDGDGEGDGDGDADGAERWKARFVDVTREKRLVEEKLARLKRVMLEVVMGS